MWDGSLFYFYNKKFRDMHTTIDQSKSPIDVGPTSINTSNLSITMHANDYSTTHEFNLVPYYLGIRGG